MTDLFWPYPRVTTMLDEIVGQDEALKYLRQVVDGRLTNPLLLVGDEGVGRRTSVIYTVRDMFCHGDKTLKCRCADCVQIAQQVHPDFTVVTAPDDKEIGIEAIRSVIESTFSVPTMAPVRVFFIDGADRLTMPAANAILKTLEEPPSMVRFFLAAESYDRVIPTIRSRCGRVPYRNLPESFIVSRLEKLGVEDGKALVYARIAEGSVGRAVRFWTSGRLKLRDHAMVCIEHAVRADVSSMFATIDQIGADLPQALRFFEYLVHDLLIAPVDPSRMVNLDVEDQVRALRTGYGANDAVWIRLRAELKLVHQRFQASYINLPFHIKTALVNTFC